MNCLDLPAFAASNILLTDISSMTTTLVPKCRHALSPAHALCLNFLRKSLGQASCQRPWPTSIASLSTTSSSLDSLFRVLFIFPSWYLCAIGLPAAMYLALGGVYRPLALPGPPPVHLRTQEDHERATSSGCTFKQPDSLTPSNPCFLASRLFSRVYR